MNLWNLSQFFKRFYSEVFKQTTVNALISARLELAHVSNKRPPKIQLE